MILETLNLFIWFLLRNLNSNLVLYLLPSWRLITAPVSKSAHLLSAVKSEVRRNVTQVLLGLCTWSLNIQWKIQQLNTFSTTALLSYNLCEAAEAGHGMGEALWLTFKFCLQCSQPHSQYLRSLGSLWYPGDVATGVWVAQNSAQVYQGIL